MPLSVSETRTCINLSTNVSLDVLENCGIAWPNPGMWWQGQQQFHNTMSPSSANHEAHSHSPRRQIISIASTGIETDSKLTSKAIAQDQSAHPAIRARDHGQNDPFWSQHGPMHDPFTGNTNPTWFHRAVASRNSNSSGDVSMLDRSRYTSSSHDQSMLDYPHHTTSSSSRNASNFEPSAVSHVGLSHPGNTFRSRQEQDAASYFDGIIAPSSPRNISTSGISAPSNTRVSSAANTPPKTVNQASGLGDMDKTTSVKTNARSVSVTTRDPPPPFIYVSSSDAAAPSMKPSAPSQHKESEDAGILRGAIKKKPAGRPKGRKEGRTNEFDGVKSITTKIQRSATTGSMAVGGKENIMRSPGNLSEGKRKRVSDLEAKIALLDGLSDQGISSPTKKWSKVEPQGIAADLDELEELTAEGVRARTPFKDIHNRM